jgi:hypothetical protein
MRIRIGRVVLDQITGDDHEIGPPVLGLVMPEHGLQGRLRDHATQRPRGLGEQVRVRQMQNPEQR